MTPAEVTSVLMGLARACQQQASTEAQFRGDLETILSGLKGRGLVVRTRVEVDRGLGSLEIVAEYGGPERESIDALGNNFNIEGSYRFTIEGWCHREAESFDAQRSREIYQATLQPLVSILTEYWGKRDTMTLLPRYSDSGNHQRLTRAIRAASLDCGVITAAHLDLDFFKQVNEEFGEPGGDEVLREFSTRIRRAFGNDCIAVRKGGEEFSLFFPCAGLSSVLPRLERFRQMMEATSFSHINRPNTCSIGIASFPIYVAASEPPKELADALLDEAMLAEKRAKSEGRNCIRLAGAVATTPNDDTDEILRDDLVEAVLWARQNLSPHDTSNFGSELHTFLAEYLIDQFRDSTIARLTKVLTSSMRTFGITVTPARPMLDYTTPGGTPVINSVKLASIAIHALLRLAISGCGPLESEHQLTLSVANHDASGKYLAIHIQRAGDDVGHVSIWATGPTQPDLNVYAGRVWTPRESQTGGVPRWMPPIKGPSLAPVLLLAIGQPSLQLHLQPWVAAVVEVDDRPVSGGGLPDFWQSNISRVIHAVLNNPNIERILAVGDETKATRTLEVLENIPGQSTSRLAQRLSIEIEAIEAFRKRKLAISRTPAERPMALQAMERAYFEAEETLSAAGEPRDLREERQRQRRIPTTGFSTGVDLLHTDGIRCGTLAEAYPRIIDMLRSISGLGHCDHMSRKFCELTGFKLILETPTVESIPYYWSQEVTSLNEYVDKQFVQTDGLFAQALRGTGSVGLGKDQYREAVMAAASAIQEGVASRRIIMITGHPHGDWNKPLGLVCVHVVPRVVKGRWKLHFQWVWRTVEALVGLPFSAYGSIQQSETILKEVNQKLKSVFSERPVPVEMGEVVYIALSLHMFLDEGDKDIARTIVLDAHE